VAWRRRRAYSCLVKLSLCGLLVLLAACGGKRSDSPGLSDAAYTGNTPNTPNVQADRMPAASGRAPTGAAADTGAACLVLRDETLQILSDAVASAPRACAADGDCILYIRRPDCVYDCGLTATVSDGALIDAAIDRVDAEFCPARCLTIPSSCGGGPGPFDQPRAVCKANQCTLDTHLTVIRETFQQTLYPLLRSHCQSCHSSDSQRQAPLFADPDVAQALDGALMFSWSGEGDRWSITDPEASPLVQLLSAQQHHCWSDCSANASEMLATIVAWSNGQAERP
jgi:hypothetical protein